MFISLFLELSLKFASGGGKIWMKFHENKDKIELLTHEVES